MRRSIYFLLVLFALAACSKNEPRVVATDPVRDTATDSIDSLDNPTPHVIPYASIDGKRLFKGYRTWYQAGPVKQSDTTEVNNKELYFEAGGVYPFDSTLWLEVYESDPTTTKHSITLILQKSDPVKYANALHYYHYFPDAPDEYHVYYDTLADKIVTYEQRNGGMRSGGYTVLSTGHYVEQ